MKIFGLATSANSSASSNRRIKLWYGLIIFIMTIFVARLFYLQVIKHDYYRKQALSNQLKEYEIAPQRGAIRAYEGGSVVPLVLNQTLYTLYADPTLVKNSSDSAVKLAEITKGKASDYKKAMEKKSSRYEILAKRLNEAQKMAITKLELPGVGTQAQSYRTYPQGALASQLLGFVNNDGEGKYGVEQALNGDLAGVPGRLKAITDARGVPLAASKDNIEISPQNGDDVTLTIDLAMQKQLEIILKKGIDRVMSVSGSALIMDPNTGAVKAMANWPSYNPTQYFDVKDQSLFVNAAVSSPLEVGSAMKVLTASAALDLGVIKPDTTYNDPGSWTLDDHTITNIEEDGGPGNHSVGEVLDLSINTGATWILMQMGGQTGSINKQARDRWHDYMVNHFQFGKITGIEQGYEAKGYVPDPNNGYALQLTYANTSFGQAMMATPLQMAAALSSAINGGTYYQPHLVDSTTNTLGKTAVKKPVVVRSNVVSPKVSGQMQSLMEYVIKGHVDQGFSYLKFPANYSIGGKTGTAQIANPSGGYYDNKYNGTYIGFVGGDKPQYVIAVKINDPKIGKYAGTAAAQPVFADLAHMLINNFNVIPKSNR